MPLNPEAQQLQLVKGEKAYGRPLGIKFVNAGPENEQPYYDVQTAHGSIRLPIDNETLTQIAEDAALRSRLEDDTIVPTVVGLRYAEMLKDRGLPFDGGPLQAWEALNSTLDAMVIAQPKVTQILAQRAAQEFLKQMIKHMGDSKDQFSKLNPSLQHGIMTLSLATEVLALQSGGVNEATVQTSKHIADIHNNLLARQSYAEVLLARAMQGLGGAVDAGLGKLGSGIDKVMDGVKDIGPGIGENLGGMLGDGKRRFKEGKKKNRVE